MNNKSLPTVDEIVNTIKRSALPIIIIEGSDDVFIYRHLKSRLQSNLISLQPCGGRDKLFQVHDRRNEFTDKKVIFIADKDSLIFEQIPQNRTDIIFTHGYCIENDIYAGSEITNILDDADKNSYENLKKIIIRWFAFEVEKFIESKRNGLNVSLSVSAHINKISPEGINDICPNFRNKIGFVEPDENYLKLVSDSYKLNLRGKQLFQMLSRFMSSKGRFSNFSDKNLIEVALKQGNNHLIAETIQKISIKIAS